MMTPKAHSNALPSEALEGFLLHEDLIVRESVAFYFYESWSQNVNLLPLALEACRRYGEEGSLTMLGFAGRYPWSATALQDALNELDRSHPPYLEDWVARAPLPLLENQEELLRRTLSFPARTRVERRHELSKLSTSSLWRTLVQTAHRIDATGSGDDERYVLRDIEDELASRVSPDAILEQLRQLDRLPGYRVKLSIIELAGAIKLQVAARLLVGRLGDPDDSLAHFAADALSRMGGSLPVRLIGKQYRSRPWDFRLYAIGVLQAIKSPSAEVTLRELLEAEEDPALRGRIFDALRFHFTHEAAELLRREILEPTSWMLDDELKKALYVNARILGREDPEAEAWVTEDEPLVDEGVLFEIPVMDLGEAP